MRNRIGRWLIQTVALWAVQRIAQMVAERFSQPDEKRTRTIPVEYERTREERIRPAGTGAVSGATAATQPAAEPASGASGSEPTAGNAQA
jgi:hypothetical protein